MFWSDVFISKWESIYMENKKFRLSGQAAVDQAIRMLKQGESVLSNSDTVPGLLANITKQGFERLNAIKQRQGRPYIVLIKSIEQVSRFSGQVLSDQVKRVLEQAWPGPLTVIFRAKRDVPEFLKSADGTIALRVPHHKGMQNLLQSFDGLFSTSANKEGDPTPAVIDDVNPDLVNKVALTILEVADADKQQHASTIIDCSGDSIVVIREGAYPVNTLV